MPSPSLHHMKYTMAMLLRGWQKYENSLTKILELKGRERRRPLSMTPPLTDLQCGEIYRGGGVRRYLSSFFHKCTPKKSTPHSKKIETMQSTFIVPNNDLCNVPFVPHKREVHD